MKKLLRQELKSYTPEWNAKCSIITDIISIYYDFMFFNWYNNAIFFKKIFNDRN